MGKLYDVLEKTMKESKPDSRFTAGRLAEQGLPKSERSIDAVSPVNPSPRLNSLDRTLVALQSPHSYEAEQIRKLRTNLFFSGSTEPLRCIMVTSALPSEGKSFIASNLAVSIAQILEEHVLLVDCDLRKADLHKRFGFGEVPGLSDHLAKNTPLPSLLLKTPVHKLTVLPGGRPPANPTELLSSKRMAGLIDEVKFRYADRVVILDSPPPQVAAETATLANRVDGIVVVVKSGYTSKKAVLDLINYLGKEKIRGIVMNYFSADHISYYGKYAVERYII